MRVLEALKIVEEAVVDCKKRNIDTSEVRDALDLLEPCCSPKWHIEGYRKNHYSNAARSGNELDYQQQVLRVYFAGIYCSIRR